MAMIALLVGWIAACSDSFAPVSLAAPDSLSVQARSLHSVLIEWPAVSDPNVIGYRLERRADLAGDFQTVQEDIPQSLPGPVFYLDQALEPETYYGYRLRVVDRFGGASAPSVVRGVRTPPRPAIVVATASQLELPDAADRDGYEVVIRSNGDSLVGPVAPAAERRFGPLPPGAYQVELRGIASNCVLEGGEPRRAVTVTDVGLETLARVVYVVSCSDPLAGRLFVLVTASGTDLDSTGFRIRVDGIADDPALPDSLRIRSDTVRFADPLGGGRQFTRLRPGDYQVALEDVDAKCTVDGGLVRSLRITSLAQDTVAFRVRCPEPPPPDTLRAGYRLRTTWSAITSGRVTLTLAVDMGAFNDPAVNGSGPDDLFAAQGALSYDSTRLRFVSAGNVTGSGLANGVFNGSRRGVIQWGNFSTNPGPQTGIQGLMQVVFDVTGGGVTQARTTVDIAESQAGINLVPNVVIQDGEVDLSGGGPPPANRAPVAQANGPYAGMVGQPITFSSAGSSDADGSVVSYAWSFGDGTGSTSANPSKAYAVAGSYTASLTVTDNQGATGTATAAVTVTPSGSGINQPPTARANGPYTGTVGAPIAFTSAGTFDPDGAVASYLWSFGDGTSSTSANVSKAYAVAGSYTASLTVTDDKGATGTAAAAVTVTAGGGGTTPFTWTGTFGGTPTRDSIVALVITLDLSTDIPETPGPESLATFVVDSLQWDPAVLEYFAFNHGPGGAGSVNATFGAVGKLSFQGTLGAANRSGLITIATVRFRVRGAPGATVTTQSAVGPLTGTASTGLFGYRSRTRIVESSLTVR
jgi:PKD repeat protein